MSLLSVIPTLPVKRFVDEANSKNMMISQNADMIDLKASGRRIAGLRNDAGMTQVELGAAIGRGRSTIAGIETGADRAGIKAIVAIADFFKVPMDWLLCRRVPPSGPQIGQFVDDPDELAWLAYWRSLEFTEREVALRLLSVPPAPED